MRPVDLMGMGLKNPIIVAAGPWARNGYSIQRSIDAGAAAVITETVTLEANANVCPRLYQNGEQLFNTKLYSDLHLEQWESEVERIKKGDSKLIFSICGFSPSEISYLASKVERMGADAIEISISAPIGTRNIKINHHSPNIHEFVKAAVNAVDIPVMVKLSYEAAISPEFTRSIYRAGAKAVSAIDALKGLEGIDIENRSALMPAYGGYTGPHIRPISLATTATLRQYTPLQICSVGGIYTFENVLEFLMLGAQAVQLASVIQLCGYDIITCILRELDNWFKKHGCSDIAQIRGTALPTLYPFEDINPKPLAAGLAEPCTENCDICINGCLYQAVSRSETGSITICSVKCSGCGLCAVQCPKRRIKLGWA